MPASRQQVLDVLRQPGAGASRLKALRALIRGDRPRAKALWIAFGADPSLFEEPWLREMAIEGGNPAALLQLLQAFAARFPDGEPPGWEGGDPAPFWGARGFPGMSEGVLSLLHAFRARQQDLSALIAGLPALPELHQDGAWFALIAHKAGTRYPLPPRLLAKAAGWAAREGIQSDLGRNARSAWPRPEWDAALRRAIREGTGPIASYEDFGEHLAGATADQAIAMARRLRSGQGALRDRWGYPLPRALKAAYRLGRAASRGLAKATMAAAAALGEEAWGRRTRMDAPDDAWPDATLLWTALGLARLAGLQAPPAADASVRGFLAAWQPEDARTQGPDAAEIHEWMAVVLRETVPPDRLERLLLEAREFPWILAGARPTPAVRARALAALGGGPADDTHSRRIALALSAFPDLLPELPAVRPGSPAAAQAIAAVSAAAGQRRG